MVERLGIGLGIIPSGLPIFGPSDTTPDAFTFSPATDAAPSTVYTSDPITITGINAAAIVTVTGGTYSKEGGGFTSAPGTASNNDDFAVRGTSSATPGASVDVVLTVGGVSATFTITTTGGGDGQLDFSDPNQSGFIPTL